jgi:hypothetical protein
MFTLTPMRNGASPTLVVATRRENHRRQQRAMIQK